MEPLSVVVLVVVVAALTAAITWWVCNNRDGEVSSSFDARIVGYSVWQWIPPQTGRPGYWHSVEDKPKGVHTSPPENPGGTTTFYVRVLAK
ncbi:MAG TPA: hypothetical protein VGF55_25120 [Gemmataceae bacterium]|jgi:hypothetical protein